MVFNLEFSERASQELNSTFQYLEENWSFTIANEFAKTIDEKINFIKSNPYQYPSYKNKRQIRRCVVTKQISFFYRILKVEIQIITFFDTRQSPAKLKLK